MSLTDWQAEDPQTPSLNDAFVNPDPIAWIEEHFYIPETRGPITLNAYQKKALREALACDGDLFRYSTIVWSDIKKSAKSTLTAAVVLWRAFQIDADEGWGSIYIIANDLKQADSRVAYYMRRAIQLNPALRAVCTVRTGRYKVTLPNHTFIEAIPIDPSGEAGANADMVVFSELWGAHSKAQAQMWTEATLPPNKFGKSFRWIETYAGILGASPILEQLYEQGVTKGHRLDDDLEMFADDRLFVLWNTRPRLAWQTAEYYASEEKTLLPSEFSRVHRNQWSAGGTERFLPSITLWDACKEDLPPLSPYEPMVLALDAGEVDDNFAAVAVSRHPDRYDDAIARYVRVWIPEQGNPLDFDAIEKELIQFIETHNVVQLCFDRYQLRQMTQRLSGIVWCDEFSQGTERLEADKFLLDAIISRHFIQDGNEILRQHVDNADRKVEAQNRIRIVKRSQTKKIDALVALSMAHYRMMTQFQ